MSISDRYCVECGVINKDNDTCDYCGDFICDECMNQCDGCGGSFCFSCLLSHDCEDFEIEEEQYEFYKIG